MSCTSCLSNNDIQTPDQVSVPCTTPYFHKDTLTPPSSSRSPPLEGGGPSTYAAHDASLYNAALYFEIYTTLLEVIQLMSIAGYEVYVCVCFFVYKTLCAAFIWLLWDAHGRPYVCLYCGEKLFNKILLQKSTGIRTNKKKILTKRRDAAAKKHRYKRSRDK